MPEGQDGKQAKKQSTTSIKRTFLFTGAVGAFLVTWSFYGAQRASQLPPRYASSSLALPRPRQEPFSFTCERPWNDMDLTRNATCGGRKCFFESITQPDQRGYLVSDASNLERMQASTRIAWQLQDEFGARHVFTYGGPQLVVINTSLAERLSAVVHRPIENALPGFVPQAFFKKLVDNNSHTITVAVQAVAVVPPPALWIGLGQGNYHLMMSQAAPTFWHAIGSGDNNADARRAWGRQFAQEIQKICQIWDRHPLLYFDFQGIVSGQTGHFYHADLDGHLGKEHWRNDTEVAQQIETQRRRLWYLYGYLMQEQLPKTAATITGHS